MGDHHLKKFCHAIKVLQIITFSYLEAFEHDNFQTRARVSTIKHVGPSVGRWSVCRSVGRSPLLIPLYTSEGLGYRLWSKVTDN